ncbi:segregation and condensation protein B [Haematobacter missouriensis]|uniref:Transcriptional regulator n=4 Tax=Paracoccaceae TaxID=31989 RepID=A0A086XVN7_9RHOB|nr:transcriptional regulator [Haematobacter massiliensis]OWJ73824.1 segregation and condensation protein B [Haematobacter massiliensis]OWJ77628.1 segregation and condensation protein B [Haematobacter genomosp. 1]OWJ81032.1 segregation and condensation protein B [Haematobacter missouriensis]OWJ86309.1 segregation and condensation protein B [Haematobacter massiliensis]
MTMAPKSSEPLDTELADLPQALRWREWMARVEAVLFAASEPMGREVLTRVVGRDCALDLLIEDISAELAGRPYEIARIAGGWQFRTKPQHAAAIRAARKEGEGGRDLTPNEALVLTIIAYMQPVTRGAIARLMGREVSRDLIARLHRQNLIARGPRSPEPGAPYTYVTTPGFLVQFGLETLRDLPDIEALQDAGLLKPVADVDMDLPIAAEQE